MLNNYSTRELVEELSRREGVERCFVEPGWQVEVAVQTDQPHKEIPGLWQYLSGGMHEVNAGPAIVLYVID